jgi:hypothetical protein
MKVKRGTAFALKGLFFIALTLCLTVSGIAQKKSMTLKIGTYDSRTIIFAYSRSDYFKKRLEDFSKRSDSAEKRHDTIRIKELSIEAISFQHLLHQMVFSTGSVSSVMKIISDKLPSVAKQAGVAMIVSKWELPYADPDIQVVDLTNQIAQLFEPKEDITKMAQEIMRNEPVPLEELAIEDELFTSFCKRFGK